MADVNPGPPGLAMALYPDWSAGATLTVRTNEARD